jgi:dATP/dGTP diphosphohydrolase
MDFVTKDSGERQEFSTGMVRDTQNDKPRYDLVDWPMIKRWADLMQRGAVKYGEHNWKKASTATELSRFQASALRHMVQWFNGDIDEDHAAACYFNIAGAEMVKEKLKKGPLAF